MKTRAPVSIILTLVDMIDWFRVPDGHKEPIKCTWKSIRPITQIESFWRVRSQNIGCQNMWSKKFQAFTEPLNN